jgi:2-phospho-L-lactate guanylyltransferase
LTEAETYSIIPVREFPTTKVRLGSILSEYERANLTKTLLKRVVDANQRSDISEIIIVSSIPDEITFLLGDFSKAKAVRESRIHGGVNSAMFDGIEHIRKKNINQKILLMPSDLPFISASAINNVLSLLDQYDLIINPSTKKDGTNLLAFALSHIIHLHYDDDSYSNHLKEAQKTKLKYISTGWKEISFDIDDPEDLTSLMRELNVNSFSSLINSLQVS